MNCHQCQRSLAATQQLLRCLRCYKAVYCSRTCETAHEDIHLQDCRNLYEYRGTHAEFFPRYFSWLQDNHRRIPALLQLEQECYRYGFMTILRVKWSDLIDLISDPTLTIMKHQVFFTEKKLFQISYISLAQLFKNKQCTLEELAAYCLEQAWAFGFLATEYSEKFLGTTGLATDLLTNRLVLPATWQVKIEPKYSELLPDVQYHTKLLACIFINLLDLYGYDVEQLTSIVTQHLRDYVRDVPVGELKLVCPKGTIVLPSNK